MKNINLHGELKMIVNDFKFSEEEVILILSVKYYSLIDEIERNSEIGFFDDLASIFSNDAKEKLEEIKNTKLRWIKLWLDLNKKLLEIVDIIERDQIESRVNNIGFGSLKMAAFYTEIAVFIPYFQLEENKEKVKYVFDDSVYCDAAEKVLKSKNIKLINARSEYKKAFSRIAEMSSERSKSLHYAAAAAFVVLLLAPYLAGGVGALAGLSGAAAVSAGLAILGGGSVAAGGFGVMGGYMMLAASGMLTGYLHGDKKYKDAIAACSSDSLIENCARLVSVITIMNKSRSLIREICSDARAVQMDFENMADDCYLQFKHEQGKQFAKKSVILTSFRRHIRVM